jgi:hypothetical protein
MPTKDWPSGELQPDEEIVEQERRKCKEGQTHWYYAFPRIYDEIVRVLAWVLRFVNRCRKVRANEVSGNVVQWEEIMLAKSV